MDAKGGDIVGKQTNGSKRWAKIKVDNRESKLKIMEEGGTERGKG